MGYPENTCSTGCAGSCRQSGRRESGCALPRREMPCILYAFWFLVGLAVLAVSLLLGAVFYETFLPVSAAIVAFAAALAAIAIALLIYYLCRKRC